MQGRSRVGKIFMIYFCRDGFWVFNFMCARYLVFKCLGLCLRGLFLGGVILVSACDDSEGTKWRNWGVEQKKLGYRCGVLDGKVVKVDKGYLFFWPSYVGRSDWESNKSPPPSGCEGVLSALTVELYYPSMEPAGRYAVENDHRVDHLSVTVSPSASSEGLSRYLTSLVGEGKGVRGAKKEGVDLEYYVGVDKVVEGHRGEYYWKELNGAVRVVIYCDSSDSQGIRYCKQSEYVSGRNLLVEMKYRYSLLREWKGISMKVRKFIVEDLEGGE